MQQLRNFDGSNKMKNKIITIILALIISANLANATNITAQTSINISKGTYTRTYHLIQTTQGLSSEIAVSGPQNITTNVIALNMGSVVNPGIAWFKNLSVSNAVQIGTGTSTTFRAFINLNAGQVCYVWLSTNSITAKAIGGDVILDYFIQSR